MEVIKLKTVEVEVKYIEFHDQTNSKHVHTCRIVKTSCSLFPTKSPVLGR